MTTEQKIIRRTALCYKMAPQAVAVLRAVVNHYGSAIESGSHINAEVLVDYLKVYLYPMAAAIIRQVDRP